MTLNQLWRGTLHSKLRIHFNDRLFVDLDLVTPDLCVERGDFHSQQPSGPPLTPTCFDQGAADDFAFETMRFLRKVKVRAAARSIFQGLDFPQ